MALTQLDDGSWRANLRELTPRGEFNYEFGLGATPSSALLEADQYRLMKNGTLTPPPAKSRRTVHLTTKSNPISLADLGL